MNKRQKLVQKQFLNNEEELIKKLEKVYSQSLTDINNKISKLTFTINDLKLEYSWLDDGDPEKARIKSMIQAKIYQKEYQEQLRKQVDGILKRMDVAEFVTISDYLDTCYSDAFIGTIFDAHGQGVPIMAPIDQEAMVRAVQLESKISKGLYTRLGEDVSRLKVMITSEVSRGISTGMTYKQVAKQLENQTKIGYNRAIRIARTEGHRIQCTATMDAMKSAKDIGADVIKQWDSTLDARTRDSHAKVDGEIRELDKRFSNGLMFPGDPGGRPEEVINCRCALLQRARWALDEGELQTLQDRAKYFGLDKSEEFDDFRKKYLKVTENLLTNPVNSDKIFSGAITGAYNNKNDPEGIKRKAHAQTYYSSMRNSDKDTIVEAIARNADVDVEAVSKMYDHLLINKYDLGRGLEPFDEDYDIAESLRRLREGKDIQAHDLLLIRHEALEHDLMNKNGLSYEKAHKIANESFNYQSALDKWLDENEG